MHNRYRVKTFIWVIASLIAGLIIASKFDLTPSLKAISPLQDNKEIESNSSDAGSNLPFFVDLVKELKPAVVNISTTKVIQRRGHRMMPFESPFGERSPFRDFFDKFFEDMVPKNYKQTSLGSGFIIDKDGYILTNNHVIERADEIKVRLSSGKEFQATIKGRDPKTDLALIKIKSWKDLPTVKMGSSDKLQVGEWVIAIGNPFGLSHTVTAGIVSAKGRIIGSGPYDDFIQTDASINPGNSGGPLFNLRGEVVGINTAIVASGQGIGFAIPINMANDLLPQLKEKGKVTRGWLGVMIQDVTSDLAESFGLKDAKGALVSDIVPESPAERAGIKQGDIIIEVDGKDVDEMNKLPRLVATLHVGKEIRVKVIRDGKEKTFRVTIGEYPEERILSSRNQIGEELGMTIVELTPDIAKQFGYTQKEGVLVSNVSPGSPADEAGIKRGDLILEINRRPVKNLESYKSILSNTKERRVLFLIKRSDSAYYVVISIPQKD